MKNRHQKSTIFSPLVFHRLRPHDKPNGKILATLIFFSLPFWDLVGFLLQGIPCFLSVFPFFPGNFRGSEERKHPKNPHARENKFGTSTPAGLPLGRCLLP